ncbi:helix-turn-helix domain-containing protein [Paraburkholderia sp.]|uniref:IclR family transcriptional regulator n=1 Tax=Paraburkholderia sp. TaxID=1926495 RepID=UPI002600D732|nr:helix-turn-helix domain-containing protein [Paraburkholderia sp.]
MDGVIKSAKRVFEVLEYFRDVRRPLAVREISAHCRYPLSSTAVLLKDMATLGYLNYDREIKAYFPTMQIAVLGDWVLESLVAHSEVQALAENVSRQCGETVIVGVQNDVFVHYAHVIPGQYQVRFFTPVGSRRALCLSGIGWAILSVQPDAVILKLVLQTIQRLGRSARAISEEYVMGEVERTRRQGYALSQGMVTRDATVIAMPLRLPDLYGRIGIGVGGPSERVDAKIPRIVEIMQRCIDEAKMAFPAPATL